MGWPFWGKADRETISSSAVWVEENRERLDKTDDGIPPISIPQRRAPVRGILLQDVWGGGSGLMQCVERQPQFYAFNITVGGRNIANPKVTTPGTLTFKVKVYGVNRDDSVVALFTTVEMDIESTAEQMVPKFVLAAQGVNLPVTRTDITVQLGNPAPDAPFIDGKDQFEIDKTNTPPETYIGVWQVKFSGKITTQYKAITALVIVTQPDLPQHIADLTDVTAYPTGDILTDRIITVWDVLDRSKDYPWKVGSKVICVHFPDVGFGIMNSTFHDMSNLNI